MINLVLVSPEMPANVGNIMRTAVAVDAFLHIVGPTVLKLTESDLKRAGLDYINKLSYKVYESYAEFIKLNAPKHLYFISRYGKKRYDEVTYPPINENVFLVFGNESKGLPQELYTTQKETLIRIPMVINVRSLNLSNAVAIVTYEVLRQRGFPNLATFEVIKGDQPV
ncbi:MAG TPA: tRNA (cytidine(34)-2'-O)-methyltransferase [Bacilli bacterium]|nr:tRNA (cytidine(34)-2'-O)-methyltransferase [Bacilli bacterium]